MTKLTDNYLECLHEGDVWLNTKAAGYAAYKTAGTVTRPLRKAGKWAAKKTGQGIAAGAKSIGNSMVNSIKNSYQNMMKKRKQNNNMKNMQKNITRNKALAAKKG